MNPIQDILSSIGISFPGDNLMRKYAEEKPPLRSELFNADQMENYGKALAGRHKLISGRAPNKLLKLLADNEEVLLEVHQLLTEAVKAERRIAPAGEWLLDNFYLIQEQIRIAKKHLPKGYNEDLPQLLSGPSAGFPRVYDIALEIISHSDGRVDLKSLIGFITAYQTITPLKLGELWAIPIMLRLALIENLRRLTAQIAIGRINQNLADYWVEQMTSTAEKDPKSLILVIADMTRSGPPMVSSFVAELTRQLQGKGPALTLPLTWIEQRLYETGQTIHELVNAETQKQAADQVSMSNSINSLRFLGITDWREFVETTSIVEQILREDVNGVYSMMDFFTRDHYRHVVERIAKNSSIAEQEVARIAIELAKATIEKNDGNDDRTKHVGYYLIGNGLIQTEKAAKTDLTTEEKFERILHKFPLLIYLGSILLVTIIVSAGLFAKAYSEGIPNRMLIVISILAFLGASQLAVTLINWLATIFIKPRMLPRMNFNHEIPSESRTLVIIPSLLSDEEELDALTESLEIYFLSNRKEHLHFGLLTDFRDASAEHLPGDDELVQLAIDKIKNLNIKYGRANDNTFFLFHRPRKWNARDKIWMGYERKRGKLTELNGLLRGKGKENFSVIIGRQEGFSNIKYVITIDSDTALPRDSASKIIGTLAHPLNHAFFDENKQRVTEGYGILQPRVALSLTGANNSLYARLHGNDLGIDPYTRTTSDVYQDIFNEGSFIGKGIYEVDIFSKALDDRFPENRILSHDLLEGCYARSGLLSDVPMYEEYPATYLDDVKRRHRWIRGDWQIAAWIFPRVPGGGKRSQKNPLSGLSRWKIFDNLRRSLVPSSLMLLLLLGWTVLPAPWFWTLSVTFILLFPFLITALRDVFRKPKEILMRQHIKDSIQAILNNFFQTLFNIATLTHESFYTLHAIITTIWRMVVTKKHLLEWNPSQNRPYHQDKDLRSTFLSMWTGPFIGGAVLIYLVIAAPINLITAFPLLVLWIASPAIAWFVSLPARKEQLQLSEEQHFFLRKHARKIWYFFEQFVGALDNWLPPDNYQEYPVDRIAHRTSPTNIGISMLANLAATDFGYITAGQFIERTSNTFATLQKMEMHRGHFYNWYDTVSLNALSPRYISSVDSGNLAGHLLTLRQGILAIPDQKIILPRFFEGMKDALEILKEDMKNNVFIEEFSSELDTACNLPSFNPQAVKQCLEQLLMRAEKMGSSNGDQKSETIIWVDKLARQSRAALEEMEKLFPLLVLSPAPEKFNTLLNLNEMPTLKESARLQSNLLPQIKQMMVDANTSEEKDWLDELSKLLATTNGNANERIQAIEQLAQQCIDFSRLEYDFLYDPSQHLLSIGYNAEEHRRDPSYYDLLASEARLCTFLGISQGKLPQDSWFALGRQLTNAGGGSVLLSWSGSMFEYLMPNLVMPAFDNTLLDHTNKAMVRRQIEYGNLRDVPWGISESGYNMVDGSLNYQYRAFGVPGIGLKRGLSEDLVVAPYATMLALMIDPEAACHNLQLLSSEKFEGRFGFFEAIDYTASRLPRGQSYVVVRSFMAHHQGMSLLALNNLLLNWPMKKRFEAEPRFQATLLLLQERIPKDTGFYSPPENVAEISVASNAPQMRVINSADTPIPEVQLLSNGKYHVMVTNAGGGYSRWKEIAVTRWREDCTSDDWGNFCYIKDLEKNYFWSAADQPAGKPGKNYEAVFSQGRAEFRRRDNDLETHTEIVVSPEDDVEIRRLHITNRTKKRRSIEVTSYAEVVLNSAIADSLHPAFSKLFVQTEIIPDRQAILCTRRPRSVEEKSPWMFHLMKAHTSGEQEVSYETDRVEFIGRGNSIADPQAMKKDGPLSGQQGSVLDPIVSIRYRITINPQESVTIDMVFGIGETREACEGLIEKYQDSHFADRAFELAWTHSQVVLRQINATEADAQLYGTLAGSVIYANASLRADPSILIKNQRGQSGLWSYSISGDLPIVLVKIEDPGNISLVKQMIQAHTYWRLKGLIVDLVIWNEDHGGYRQLLQNQLTGLVSTDVYSDVGERPGGIFVRVADQISIEDRILIQSVARIIISDSNGTLDYQINKRSLSKTITPALIPKLSYALQHANVPLPKDLLFFNGLGGFSSDGKEYIVSIDNNRPTPAPWINVLANPHFGCIISESGQSYTWVDNAHEFRLSPWNNDPVTDSAGEVFYIRDDDSGHFWSPTFLPVYSESNYIIRHGFGYSVFAHIEDGIHSEMCVYVHPESMVKFTVLKIKNRSGRPRRLSVTGYVEWVLGDLRSKSVMHVITEIDPTSGALLAKNPYNKEFENRVCFFDVNDPDRTFTADRTEFIGRNASLRNPDAMKKMHLSGKSGAALDPCGALQVAFELADGHDSEHVFLLGTAKNSGEASNMVHKFRASIAARNVLEEVHAYWQKTLGSINVQTPDQSLNVLINGWLLYQTLSCRMRARSGYYQSGGAFGFRDQLQDAMAVMHVEPQLAREQILLSASRQFKEGDVQHWWHPPSGRGVRTRCSDDFLWLPFVTCKYVSQTGDSEILDESVHFLEGRSLIPEEDSYYDLPGQSDRSASLYDHCVLAIKHGLRFGSHGIPLIGSGDWNDGMDKVGHEGKGESVWLGFFLYDVLVQFSEIARSRKDTAFADQCRNHASTLNDNIEKNAWDGEWYRRAWFDDGTPLGSSKNDECSIDSISQSWSVLSGRGNVERSHIAMESAYKNLVRKDISIIQLLDPPFDKSEMNPGYIKGYVPGVRENGGQYTHAAIWLTMAFAALKNNDRAWELFSMINPINHGTTLEEIDIYKVEPYVVAADVYSVKQHRGRGGWTWYTGSAGWMYRLIIEYILGLKIEGDTLSFNPCMPSHWNSFMLDYKYQNTTYHIKILQAETGNGTTISMDGKEQHFASVSLVNDGGEHRIEIRMNVGMVTA